MDPISSALAVANELINVLFTVKEICDKRRDNKKIAQEVDLFIENLMKDVAYLRNKCSAHSNMATWAAESIRRDLQAAAETVQSAMSGGFFKSIWNVHTIHEKLSGLRVQLMTAFQAKLQFVTLDVAVNGKEEQQRFQATLLEWSTEMSTSMRQGMGMLGQGINDLNYDMRREMRGMRQELKGVQSFLKELIPFVNMAAQHRGGDPKVDEVIEVFRASQADAQTDYCEKFFADVLANLEQLREHGEHNAPPAEQGDDDSWYLDPITFDTMCDPVKCSNGKTFDRWTIIHHNLTRCPYDRSSALSILVDDIDVRSRIFEKFPDQYDRFLSLRREYRAEALEQARAGHDADAIFMLDHVLRWSKSDAECEAKRAEIVARQARAAAAASARQRPPDREPPPRPRTETSSNAKRSSSSSTSTQSALDRLREILGSQASPQLMSDALRMAKGDVASAVNFYWEKHSQQGAVPPTDPSNRYNMSDMEAEVEKLRKTPSQSTTTAESASPRYRHPPPPPRAPGHDIPDFHQLLNVHPNCWRKVKGAANNTAIEWRDDSLYGPNEEISTDRPMPATFRGMPCYYFEMSVINSGKRRSTTAVGMKVCTVDTFIDYMAFASDGGQRAGNSHVILTSRGKIESYGAGDTVGVGLHMHSKTIFMTKNGSLVYCCYALIPHIPPSTQAQRWPILLLGQQWKVNLNFGHRPFLYDFRLCCAPQYFESLMGPHNMVNPYLSGGQAVNPYPLGVPPAVNPYSQLLPTVNPSTAFNPLSLTASLTASNVMKYIYSSMRR